MNDLLFLEPELPLKLFLSLILSVIHPKICKHYIIVSKKDTSTQQISTTRKNYCDKFPQHITKIFVFYSKCKILEQFLCHGLKNVKIWSNSCAISPTGRISESFLRYFSKKCRILSNSTNFESSGSS